MKLDGKTLVSACQPASPFQFPACMRQVNYSTEPEPTGLLAVVEKFVQRGCT